MHQLDSQLAQMKEELKVATDSLDTAAEETLNKAITARENQLLPLYLQISHEFADLHDRPGRMKAKGVIRDVVRWPYLWCSFTQASTPSPDFTDFTMPKASSVQFFTKWS